MALNTLFNKQNNLSYNVFELLKSFVILRQNMEKSEGWCCHFS